MTPASEGVPPVRCTACGEVLARELPPLLRDALAALELAASVGGVTVCADDLPEDGDGWLDLVPATGGGLPRLVLYCAPWAFGDPRRAPRSEAAVWERRPAPAEEPPLGEGDFDRTEAAAFVHHHLLLAADVLAGRLIPDLVPGSLAEAFGESWAATIDGRLARRGLPGYTQARRRARFSRLFSAAGVLMPGHWQIFQSLWDGALQGQGEVLAAVRQLPRLQRARGGPADGPNVR